MTLLTLTHQNLPGVTVIVLAGELDIATKTRLPAFLDQVRQQPTDQVVLDLTELKFMDSSGLDALLACRNDILQHGGDMRVAAPQRGPARVLEITRVNAHLTVHDTVEHAIAAAVTAARIS